MDPILLTLSTALNSYLPEQDDRVGEAASSVNGSLGSWAGGGEVGEYLPRFPFCCDAMVMPRKMEEGGREGETRKEMGRGAQGVMSRGHAECRRGAGHF